MDSKKPVPVLSQTGSQKSKSGPPSKTVSAANSSDKGSTQPAKHVKGQGQSPNPQLKKAAAQSPGQQAAKGRVASPSPEASKNQKQPANLKATASKPQSPSSNTQVETVKSQTSSAQSKKNTSKKKGKITPGDLPRASQLWFRDNIKVPKEVNAASGIQTNPDLYRYGYYRQHNADNLAELVRKIPKYTFNLINPFFKILYFSSGYHSEFISEGGGTKKITILNLVRCEEDKDMGEFTVEEISSVVPGGKVVIFPKEHKAEVTYRTPEEAKEAFKKTKLVWLRFLTAMWKKGDEAYVIRLPRGVGKKDVHKKFKHVESVKVVQGRKGKNVAVCAFQNKANMEKEYKGNILSKIGPQILSWMGDDVMAPNVIRVINLPEDVVEYDLETMFPTSKGVSLELRDTNYRADVKFGTPQLADEAEHMNFLIKVGRLKLAWVRKDEIYISELPKDTQPEEIVKQFPGSSFVKYMTKDDGQKMAVLKYRTATEADKAYMSSKLIKLNRHHLAWSKPKTLDEGKPLPPSTIPSPIPSEVAVELPEVQEEKGTGTFNHKEIIVHGIPLRIGNDEIFKKFPRAKIVRLGKYKDQNTAHVTFNDRKDALAAFEGSIFAHRGYLRLDWTLPTQLKIVLIPFKASKSAIMSVVKNTKSVTFLNASRIAVVDFASEKDAKHEYAFSHLYPAGDRCLSWLPIKKKQKDKKEKDDDYAYMPEEKLAKLLWKIPGSEESGIGQKYIPLIQISNLPPDTSEKYLKKAFPTARSVNTEKREDHIIAVLGFDNVEKAATAYKVVSNMKFEKFVLHLKTMNMRML